MSLIHDFITVYPRYRLFIQAVSTIPLSARGLIIKACQAQKWPECSETSTLRSLIEAHPPVIILLSGTLQSKPLYDVIPFFEIELEDPLESAIILDICRGMTLPQHEIDEAKLASWKKEITLAQGTSRTSSLLNWDIFFDPQQAHLPLFPEAEPNPAMCRHIYNILSRFRNKYRGKRLYPRSTHKNMSRDTRRKYEEAFESLDNVPIFGQDDWQRVYHEHGIKLQGASEMRQKWYPSGSKPRTYFAMGGTAYTNCRHLQNFFSDLVNEFVPTNHFSRLQPDRLFVDPHSRHGRVHFRIYDMSNFTSNMAEQKFFMPKLAQFFAGIEVEVVDERDGLITCDLGEMLEEYNRYCVENPELSIERFDPDYQILFGHGIASLLGIFGNLMSCTLAHYFIMTPVVNDDEEINVAGDDGLIPEDELDTLPVQDCWDKVGSCAREKTFRGDEDAAICLKRPFVEDLPHAITTYSIIPPTVTVASAYLSGKPDSRYSIPDLEHMSRNKKISIVGKDLMRFLRSAYLRGYRDIDRLSEIYVGFCRLVKRYQGIYPISGLDTPGSYFWPIDPCLYEFHDIAPQSCLVLYRSPSIIHVRRLETIPEPEREYNFVGEEFEGNMSPRLSLLEKLGYLEAVPQEVTLSEVEVVAYYSVLFNPKVFVPVVYSFVVLKDVPVSFCNWSSR